MSGCAVCLRREVLLLVRSASTVVAGRNCGRHVPQGPYSTHVVDWSSCVIPGTVATRKRLCTIGDTGDGDGYETQFRFLWSPRLMRKLRAAGARPNPIYHKFQLHCTYLEPLDMEVDSMP